MGTNPQTLNHVVFDCPRYTDADSVAMKATIIKYLRNRHELAARARAETGISITRTQSRATSIHDRVVVLEPDVVHSPCCSQGWLWPESARKAGGIARV